MSLVDGLLSDLPSTPVGLRDVRIGPFWTIVWTDRGAGLASTQRDTPIPHGEANIQCAGQLMDFSPRELAGLLRSSSPMEAGLGMAAVNALLEVEQSMLSERNAATEIMDRGKGKRVVIVGHFPFISQVQQVARHLDVLELTPGPGDLPAQAAKQVIPQADVVAITGTCITNRTFGGLIELCRPEAFVLVLGPTTPLSPRLFDYGVDLVAGTQVIDPVQALTSASQGANFRQMRGVRLVTMVRNPQVAPESNI